MEKLALSQQLKELRIKHHYTQAYVSSRLNIGRATYSNYELGKRMPSLDLIVDLAKFYRVPVNYLIFPEEQAFIAATLEKSHQPLSDDELSLLSSYRALSKFQKKEILDFVTFLRNQR